MIIIKNSYNTTNGLHSIHDNQYNILYLRVFDNKETIIWERFGYDIHNNEIFRLAHDYDMWSLMQFDNDNKMVYSENSLSILMDDRVKTDIFPTLRHRIKNKVWN